MTVVALVDPYWSGHHPMYVRLFSRALLDLGHAVVALCPNPDAVREQLGDTGGAWRGVAFRFPEEPIYYRLDPRARRQQIRRLARLGAALDAVEAGPGPTCDLVFLCYLDPFLGPGLSARSFARRLGRPFSGLYFQPWHLRMRTQWLWARVGPLDRDRVLRAPSCLAVGVLDEGIAGVLGRRLRGASVVCFPDLTESGSDAETPTVRMVREKARGRRVVGLVGSVDRRKGLVPIIHLCKELPDIFFLVVGRVVREAFAGRERAAVEDFLATPPENALVIDRFIESDREFNGLVGACDLLWGVYQEFSHSSNLLGKAAALHVPVLVADGYVMAERVQRYGLGLVVPEHGGERVLGLLRSGEGFALRASPAFNAGCRAYAEAHSFERLKEAFARVIANTESALNSVRE